MATIIKCRYCKLELVKNAVNFDKDGEERVCRICVKKFDQGRLDASVVECQSEAYFRGYHSKTQNKLDSLIRVDKNNVT